MVGGHVLWIPRQSEVIERALAAVNLSDPALGLQRSHSPVIHSLYSISILHCDVTTTEVDSAAAQWETVA